MIQIFVVAAVLGVIVTIHEFGHFLSARSIGIAVQEFAVGMGPAIYKRQGKGALFSIRLIPFGRYCLFDPSIEGLDRHGRPMCITKRKALEKIYVSVAGPVFNFALAAFFLLCSFLSSGSR